MPKVIVKKTKKKIEKQTQMKKVMRKMERIAQEEQAFEISRRSHLPYLDLNLMPLSGDDIRLIPEKDSRKHKLAIIKKSGRDVRLALVEPKKRESLDYVKNLQRENGWRAHLYIVSEGSMQKVWRVYRDVPLIQTLDSLHLKLEGKELEDFERKFGGLLDLKRRIKEIPTTKIIQVIMAGAIKMDSSDIHFEPEEEEIRLRFRIDGVLQDIGRFPLDVYKFILSRIKIMAGMKINIRNTAQDGHFSINLPDGKMDLRVSIIPGNFGETIVMRLLNVKNVMVNLEELGLRGLAYDQVKNQIAKINGMILTTGPTGSGKTTTLYSIINILNSSEVKIITIENPVEYEIKGVTQTQVNNSRGYTFSKGLRAIVRQDPDIILVGEIRDEETADIAINAALTGHLVLSTLHTNHAVGSIARLIELGVKPTLIGPAVNAFMAQRLVRKLCPHCRKKYKVAKETEDNLKEMLSLISPKAKVEIPKEITHLYKPVGCPRCNNIGYKGRVGIFEVFVVSSVIESLILEMASEDELMRAAMEEGMVTMTQDGVLKAVSGEISMEEVWRVAGQTEFLREIYEKLMDQTLSRSIVVDQKSIEKIDKNTTTLEKLEKFIETTKQKELAKVILASALLLEASDVHIEPEEKEVKIRFRIDEILQDVANIPLSEYPSLLGEIKHLCGLKTEVRGGVQDSRFFISLDEPYKNVKDTKVDVRVSIILGGFGETTVMRLLNKGSLALDINKLGIRQQNLDKLLNEIKKPNGVIMNTGPTGSGKSTTLYSLLKLLNEPSVKIITVEDPIEYRLSGILQTQVNEKEGYTFSTALRSLLRQNPDVMMVGEIRDEETASLAMQASLTGHLVFTTLHTNDSAGSVQRLANMGVRPDEMASAVNAFMAQRLVRRLCSCKKKEKLDQEQKEQIVRVLNTISSKSGISASKNIDYHYLPQGCEKCKGIGYQGIEPISEVLVLDKEIKELVSRMALPYEIKDKAVENGMITMVQDGFLKVLEGATSLAEVERVTEE